MGGGVRVEGLGSISSNKWILVTPTPKIRTLQPSYDCYRVI